MADEVLVAVMMRLCCDRTPDPAQEAMEVSILQEILPEISRGHGAIDCVADCAARVVAWSLSSEGKLSDRRRLSSIKTEGALALADHARWRLGEARARWEELARRRALA